MKKLTILFLSVAVLLSFTKCNNSTSDKLCSNAATRGKIISELLNNDAYLNEMMDSMQTKHPDVILSNVFVIAKSDKPMQENMMDKMTDMCKMDSSMCKMMIDKTMDMCEADQSKCGMMMGSMQSRPNVMKSIQGMRH